MANWIVQNCLDPSDIRVSSNGKNQLSAGVIFSAGGMVGTIGCFQAQSETLDLATLSPTNPNSTDCVDCLVSNGFNLIFRDCTTLSDYYISPESFSGSGLPTVGTIYEASIGGANSFMGCFEFIGATADLFSQSPITIINQYQTCSECQGGIPGGFSVSFDREILINNSYGLNKGGTLSISGDYTEPFTYFISDDNQVENVRIEGSSLIIGDSIGTLGIMLVDSNNFSATTTTEVLRRVSFNTNKGDIVNDVNYQNFKQGVQDNYNLLIQNRINPQSQENAK